MYDKQMNDGLDSVGFGETVQVREQTFDEATNPMAGALEANEASPSFEGILHDEEKEYEPPPLEKEKSSSWSQIPKL